MGAPDLMLTPWHYDTPMLESRLMELSSIVKGWAGLFFSACTNNFSFSQQALRGQVSACCVEYR